MTRPPHVQRCTHRQAFGTGVHARTWQCTLTDPHPDAAHDYGIDAEDFGRVLPLQDKPWLVGTLRSLAATLRHERRRNRDLTAIATQLAALAAHGTPVDESTAAWVGRNAPTAAEALHTAGTWHLTRGRDT